MGQRIYLDHAATTAVAPEVFQAMQPYLASAFGNPSGVYAEAREARAALEKARVQVAGLIGADPPEVYFTSGGSESDNWAIKGAAFAGRTRGNHLITTAIEHHAVLSTCRWMEKQGFRVTYVPPDAEGRIDPDAVAAAIGKETILISVMAANNEVGTVEPVSQIGAIARERGILFHTDAVQAAGILPVDVRETGADLLSLSGHKFHGPKGIGALYIRRGTRIDPLIHGGAQERNLRAGTENLAGIAGLGAAAERAGRNRSENALRMARLRDRLIQGILEEIPGSRLNGPEKDRLPGNCHVSFEGVDGAALVMRLDLAGIAASVGSACVSGAAEVSHVLLAMGRSEEEARSSLRLTLGEETTAEEIGETLERLKRIIREMRERG